MTIRFELRTMKKAAGGRCPLHVSVSDGRKYRRRRVTGILVDPAWWDAKTAALKRRVPIPEAERSAVSREMSALKSHLLGAYAAGGQTPSWLEKALADYDAGKVLRPGESRAPSFDELFDLFADGREISPSRRRHYRVLQRMIHRFEVYVRLSTPEKSQFSFDIGQADLSILNRLRDFLKDERRYVERFPGILSACPEHREISARGDNYLHSLFKLLRAFFSWCIKAGHTRNWPFTDFEMPKEEYGTPILMTLDEVMRLYRAPMPTRVLAEQRDIFVFQCNVGCRVGDLIGFTKDSVQGGVLEYIAAKTLHSSGRTVTVPLNAIARKIVEKYKNRPGNLLLPFVDQQSYNRYIRAAFTAAGLTRMVTTLDPVTRREVRRPLNQIASSHLARRTFAGNIYRQVKDPNLVASLTGHAEGSRAFSRYREIDLGMKQELVKILENGK